MTTLWINGRLVGSCNSLCTPHVYDITDFVTKPLVEILVLVENTGYPTKGGHLTRRTPSPTGTASPGR
ncbi:MAG: hypothetical protein ACLUOF_10915 [Ruminococcus sp.]